VTGVLTNTMLTGPYRGAGRPEAAYVIETMVDLAARQLGLDPAELRRRNTIPASAMPYKTALVYTYDCGDFGKNLEDCLVEADYAGFAARFEDARRHGKVRGIGISNTVESSNARLIEHAEIRFFGALGDDLLGGGDQRGSAGDRRARPEGAGPDCDRAMIRRKLSGYS
jgi:carbon-monoxide dehydrogenase large subunit